MFLALCTLASAGELAERHAYERAVAAATREVRIYDGWYTALLLRGTRVDDPLRRAQAARLAETTNGASPGPVTPEGPVVVLTAGGQWKDELRFSADGSTPWTITLYAGETACAAPASLVVTKRPNAADHLLYPHLTDWDKLIQVTWPADACGGAEPDRLVLSSGRGRGELRWGE